MNVDRIKKVVAEAEQANELVELLYSTGGRLSEGGKGIIAEGKKRGYKQKKLADLLGITPAAVYNHWHNIDA